MLLCAIVQIPLDSPALRVLGRDNALPRCPQLFGLCAQVHGQSHIAQRGTSLCCEICQ
jgi:hypothetical protein